MQNGGRIEVYSELEQGSTFKIYFPASEESVALASEAPRTRLTGGRGTVLLVEDNELVRTSGVRSLEALGYTVLSASSGQEALEIAARDDMPIDLLFTDVVMPGMSGRELAQALNAIRPDVRVLYASGFTENVIAHRGVLEPGVRLLAKPYDLETLAARIREALEGD